MPETERLEDRESLEGVKSGEIASRLFDISVAMRSDEVRPLGHDHRKELATKARSLLDTWLADNQAFKQDLSKLRMLIGRLNEYIREHKALLRSDSHWPELKDIQQQLNAYLGCLHLWEGLEVGQDDEGLHVLCTRCGYTTRNLRDWGPPKE